MPRAFRLVGLLFALAFVACSSLDVGTETGNPTKHGGACRPSEIIFDVGSAAGLELASVTVDGDPAPCVADGARVRCTVVNTKDGFGVDYSWTIAAEGHDPQTLQFAVDWAAGKCGESQNVVEVQLDAAASQ